MNGSRPHERIESMLMMRSTTSQMKTTEHTWRPRRHTQLKGQGRAAQATASRRATRVALRGALERAQAFRWPREADGARSSSRPDGALHKRPHELRHVECHLLVVAQVGHRVEEDLRQHGARRLTMRTRAARAHAARFALPRPALDAAGRGWTRLDAGRAVGLWGVARRGSHRDDRDQDEQHDDGEDDARSGRGLGLVL